MKILKIALLFLILTVNIIAKPVIIYNPSNGRVITYLLKAHTPDYEEREDVIIFDNANPDVPECEIKYWIVQDGTVREMTTEEKAIIDEEIIVAQEQVGLANANIDNFYSNQLAAILVALDELNIVLDYIIDFKLAITSAQNFAEMKSNVTALPNLNQKTRNELRDEILTKYGTL
jgi:hypothetical protein